VDYSGHFSGVERHALCSLSSIFLQDVLDLPSFFGRTLDLFGNIFCDVFTVVQSYSIICCYVCVVIWDSQLS